LAKRFSRHHFTQRTNRIPATVHCDKEALRSAVARLNYRTNTKFDMERPPMSEYIAMKIREGDEQVMTYYIQEVQKQSCFRAANTMICSVTPQAAKQMVRNRAQQIVVESAPATDNTLRLLEGLMRSAAQLPGRKLVFVISDGFYLNDRKTGAIDRIKKVTDAAGRAGVVIYTLDARGIVGDSIDVTNNKPMEARKVCWSALRSEKSRLHRTASTHSPKIPAARHSVTQIGPCTSGLKSDRRNVQLLFARLET
jgi:hypothetical protein